MAVSCFFSEDWCALADHTESCRCWWSHNTETRIQSPMIWLSVSLNFHNNSRIPAPGTGHLCPGILWEKKEKNKGRYGCDIYLKPSACWWIKWKSFQNNMEGKTPGNRHATSPLNFIPIREFELLPKSFVGKGNAGYRWPAVHHVLERKLIPAEKFFPQSQSITACNKKGEISIYSDVRFDWVLFGESVISLPKPSISALEVRVHFMITFISFFVLSFFEHVQ